MLCATDQITGPIIVTNNALCPGYWSVSAHDVRTWDHWRREGSLNYPRAFGLMTYLPEPLCKVSHTCEVSRDLIVTSLRISD